MTTAATITGRYVFSHNDIQESAQDYKDRTEESTPIDEDKFISLIGNSEYEELVSSFGCFGDTFKSEDCIYVSIQNIDYIFTEKH